MHGKPMENRQRPLLTIQVKPVCNIKSYGIHCFSFRSFLSELVSFSFKMSEIQGKFLPHFL